VSRPITTQKLSQSESTALLAEQRLRRPTSPHLDIYDKKQTYFGASIWQRFTGAGYSGALYAFGISYLAAPYLGWHLESASIAAFVAGLPVIAKGGLKFALAWPYVFHAINGVRHLTYDMAIGFQKATILKLGWYIWGASIVGGLGLAFFY